MKKRESVKLQESIESVKPVSMGHHLSFDSFQH